MTTLSILSGGLDSATALAMALDKGLVVDDAVWFGYGQRHSLERGKAWMLAEHYQIKLHEIAIPNVFASNQLTDKDQTPRQGTPMNEITAGVAPTFVPGRNMIMLALAASMAVKLGCSGVVGGWHWDDSSGYPDCRASFLISMQATINEALGTTDFEVHTPLISLSKGQIASNAVRLDVPIRDTWSCYNPVGDDGFMLFYEANACGQCDSCQLRIKGFKDAGFIDPIRYAIPIDWAGCDPIPARRLL